MRLIALTLCVTIMAVFFHAPNSHQLHAWKYTTDVGGGGYQEVRTCVALAPAALFALVALGAIVAVLIKNEKSNGHSHSHAH